MNHILLPGCSTDQVDTRAGMYGLNLMELLLNDLFKKGALKSRLEVKLFGGSNMGMSGLSMGQKNADFIEEYTKNEGLNVISKSLGGSQGRRIEFVPTLGKTRQRLMDEVTVEKTEAKLVMPVKPASDTGSMELF